MRDRWSREQARDRWHELGTFVGRPLGLGLVVDALWPLFPLFREWTRYERPGVAVAVYVASTAIVGLLWWRGRTGIGLGLSVGCTAALVLLNVVLTLQVPAGPPPGAALWLHGWGAAVPMVLAFGRPIEEPLGALGLLALSNTLAVGRQERSLAALHDAPIHIGMPVTTTVCGIALVAALRGSVRSARRSRARAEALTQRERAAEAVEQHRNRCFVAWERDVLTLLDGIGAGTRSVRDPEVRAHCVALDAVVRAHLDLRDESILCSLLPPVDGVSLVVRDLDVGHRVVEEDRVVLVQLVRGICRGGARGSLQLTVQPAGAPGEPVRQALAVLAGVGLPPPQPRPGGTLVVEDTERWYYDLTLSCS